MLWRTCSVAAHNGKMDVVQFLCGEMKAPVHNIFCRIDKLPYICTEDSPLVNSMSFLAWTPLGEALSGNDEKLALYLLQQPNRLSCPEREFRWEVRLLWFLAIVGGFRQVAGKLTEIIGFDFYLPTFDWYDILRLNEARPDHDHKIPEHMSRAIEFAAFKGHLDIVRFLIGKYRASSDPDKITLLQAVRGHFMLNQLAVT
jgi:hypothetical protein